MQEGFKEIRYSFPIEAKNNAKILNIGETKDKQRKFRRLALILKDAMHIARGCPYKDKIDCSSACSKCIIRDGCQEYVTMITAIEWMSTAFTRAADELRWEIERKQFNRRSVTKSDEQ
jgi:hypothetical protein